MLSTVTSDTKAIIGSIIGTGLVVAGLLSAQIAAVNTRIDDLADRIDRIETRMDRIENRLDGFDERLRNVEIAFGKVDQRLLTLERILLPPRPPASE